MLTEFIRFIACLILAIFLISCLSLFTPDNAKAFSLEMDTERDQFLTEQGNEAKAMSERLFMAKHRDIALWNLSLDNGHLPDEPVIIYK